MRTDKQVAQYLRLDFLAVLNHSAASTKPPALFLYLLFLLLFLILYFSTVFPPFYLSPFFTYSSSSHRYELRVGVCLDLLRLKLATFPCLTVGAAFLTLHDSKKESKTFSSILSLSLCSKEIPVGR